VSRQARATRRQQWLRALGGIGLALGVLGLIIRYQNGGLQVLVVAACFVPYLAPPVLLGAAFLALARCRVAAGIAVLVAIGLLATQLPSYLRQDSAVHNGNNLVVLTANMRRGHAYAPDLVSLVRARGVDVLAVQELTPEAEQRLVAAGIQRVLPFSHVAAGERATGVGLWSRYELADQQRYLEFFFHEVSATIKLTRTSRPITIFSTHLLPPWPSSPKTWSAELSKLGRLLRERPGTVVNAGDFNSTIDHAQFRQMLADARYSDAATQAGAGTIRTYPASGWLPPMIRIDHVLTRQAVASSASTVQLRGSDHRGLLVRIVVPS
jgi:endonuclease/exonuclease/phosphatase (EEP) superfamily protein YafD